MTGTNFEMADSEQALTPVNTNLFQQERYRYELSMLHLLCNAWKGCFKTCILTCSPFHEKCAYQLCPKLQSVLLSDLELSKYKYKAKIKLHGSCYFLG